MCKPIVSSKNFLSEQKTFKDKEDSDELYKNVKDFLVKVSNSEEMVDEKILNLIEESIKKAHF